MRVLPLVLFLGSLSLAAPALASEATLAAVSLPALPASLIAEAPAPSTKPATPMINQPDWERKPSAEDLARLYPAAAFQAGKSGRATLRCKVKGDGTLEGCVVASETPREFGFGAQALKLAPLFKMPPQTKGEPVAGKLVNVPIQFRLS